jgi:maltose O-acetyltransferase
VGGARADRDHGQRLAGGGVIVGPGVTRTTSSAGAVVVRDLPANVVAVGNPTRVIRTFDR